MGDKQLTKITATRFCAFVERFLEWGERRSGRLGELPIFYVLNYSSNYDRTTLQLLKRLWERFPHWSGLDSILTGGLLRRDGMATRGWLSERQSFGCKYVITSFAGAGAIHDYWNGRPGDFDHLLNMLRIACELGMELETRVFLTRSTLATMQELFDRLDELPPHSGKRVAFPFAYAGWGARLEGDRIDEKIREALPPRVTSLIEPILEYPWRSEREWINHLRGESSAEIVTDIVLNVTDDNINRLESMCCDEIFSELHSRTLAAYAAIPALHELRERYGDNNGLLIYDNETCLERKWLDQHLDKCPTYFERQLTHLAIGN